MIKNFRNILALVLIVLILALWSAQGMAYLNLSGEVVGATIVIFTLVGQFYFRKKPASESNDN